MKKVAGKQEKPKKKKQRTFVYLTVCSVDLVYDRIITQRVSGHAL